MTKRKRITEPPAEASREEVAAHYDTTDVSDLEGWERNTTAPAVAVSIRLDPGDLVRLREIARSRGVGHTQLARQWILAKLGEEGSGAGDASQTLLEMSETLRDVGQRLKAQRAS